jgi:glycosyltransferase involved in cell wall biosynthesis
MRVLIALTYFQPHKSGLTVYAVRLAQALVARGHSVKVLTSHYDRHLPRWEQIDGVEVIRVPVLMRISKGVIMPTLPIEAFRLIHESDVINLHVPQFDAAILALMGRLAGKPIVVTYQSDLLLPSGAINWVANRASYLADRVSAGIADKVISMSYDFAEHSFFLPRYLSKVSIVAPPIYLQPVSEEEIENFKARTQILPGQQVIGMVARLATEKGVEYMIGALPQVLEKYPQARVLFVGPYQNVVGENAYARRLMPMIQNLGEHWQFLGVVSDHDLAAFFHVCNLLVLPSVNSTESFGLVQIEAMTCGTPVVASDLPGIRQPVLDTRMGRLVPPRNPRALAEAVISVLAEGDRSLREGYAAEIAQRYSPQATAANYEAIFKELLSLNGKR